jgi:hypothetical protein
MGWRPAFKRFSKGFEVFPFSILRLSFVIAGTANAKQWQMTNVIMENERLGNNLGEDAWPQTF